MKRFLKRYWHWAAATLVFAALIFVFADTNLFEYIAIRDNVRQLRSEAERYRAQSSADSLFVARMGNDNFVERYAREQFYMHAENEEIFLVEPK